MTRRRRRLLETPLNASMLSMAGLDPGNGVDDGIAPTALFNNDAERDQFLALTDQRMQIELQVQRARNAYEELRQEKREFAEGYAKYH